MIDLLHLLLWLVGIWLASNVLVLALLWRAGADMQHPDNRDWRDM